MIVKDIIRCPTSTQRRTERSNKFKEIFSLQPGWVQGLQTDPDSLVLFKPSGDGNGQIIFSQDPGPSLILGRLKDKSRKIFALTIAEKMLLSSDGQRTG